MAPHCQVWQSWGFGPCLVIVWGPGCFCRPASWDEWPEGGTACLPSGPRRLQPPRIWLRAVPPQCDSLAAPWGLKSGAASRGPGRGQTKPSSCTSCGPGPACHSQLQLGNLTTMRQHRAIVRGPCCLAQRTTETCSLGAPSVRMSHCKHRTMEILSRSFVGTLDKAGKHPCHLAWASLTTQPWPGC